MILGADRRFGRSTEFIFFMFDYIEKKNIHSASRLVVPVLPGIQYTRALIHDGNRYILENVSRVPYTIRSSRAYKKRHGLNLLVIDIFNFIQHPTLPVLSLEHVYKSWNTDLVSYIHMQ